MILSKTVEDKDYKSIECQVSTLQATLDFLTNNGAKIELGHPHRMWEYGMALKAFETWIIEASKTDSPEVLDVGAGDGLLGPSFAWGQNLSITELEPRQECFNNRMFCNSLLKTKLNLLQNYEQLAESYDVVFSISVIEHVVDDHNFLKILASKVKSGGMLFLTTDVMPTPTGKFHFDNLREHNYWMFDIKKKIEYLKTVGFQSLGGVDLEYKGDRVFNYSFASIAMVKQ